MRTPSLFSRALTLSLVFACGLLAACAAEDPEPDDVQISDYAVVEADGTVKVLVCHLTNIEFHEIEIAFSAVRSHLSHGDFLGPCELPPPR